MLPSPTGRGHRKLHRASHIQTENHGPTEPLEEGCTLQAQPMLGAPVHTARATQPPWESPTGCGSDSAAPHKPAKPVFHPRRKLTACDSVSALQGLT